MNNKEVAKLATKALLYEVSISPKAGLVSRLSNGSHKDMDFYTFIDSALSLDNYFSKESAESIKVYKEASVEAFQEVLKYCHALPLQL